ncbi:MAG: mannose-6-phosphate isomerase, class I [Acidobacteriota bacterium]
MKPLARLRHPTLGYAWGSTTAIPELLGREPTGEPLAELWMGAHPKAPSDVWIDGSWMPLNAAIARRPRPILRDLDAPQLPFLFKILAAGKALSIQAHPGADQARRGFEREEADGLPVDSPRRSYRDRQAKPEILYALTPFAALRGFRGSAAIADLWHRFGLAEILDRGTLGRLEAEEPAALDEFFQSYLGLDGARLETALARAIEAAERIPTEETTVERRALDENRDPSTGGVEIARAARWLQELAQQYPGDRGVLGPLFLEVVELSPGEALFTPPRMLHAYLEGVGVELMSSSDNVLRGGLTAKHVDLAELRSVVAAQAAASGRLPADGEVDGARRFSAPDGSLTLTDLRFDGAPVLTGPRPGILLCVDGEGVARVGDAEEAFARGDSLLVDAGDRFLEIEGRGRLVLGEGSGSGDGGGSPLEA